MGSLAWTFPWTLAWTLSGCKRERILETIININI